MRYVAQRRWTCRLPRIVIQSSPVRMSFWHTAHRPIAGAGRAGRASLVSSPSGVCIASAGERAIGAHLPARTLERVLRGKPARSVLDLVQQIECVVVLVPPRSGVGQEQEDVERSGVVFVDAQLVLGLIENLQRSDLDPIEEAGGLKRLTEEFGLTHEEVAERIGKHRVSVTQSLRLLNGCPAVQSAVAAGVITSGHARALIALDSQAAQEHGLKVVVARHLSVRQTENWVRTYRPRRRRGGEGSAELRRLAAEMESKVGLPVKVTGTINRGTIELKYSSQEDLERVCAKLVS